MSELDNFITSCTFKGKEYMIKMNIQNNKSLEMTLTKKHSGELWKCSFDAQGKKKKKLNFFDFIIRG